MSGGRGEHRWGLRVRFIYRPSSTTALSQHHRAGRLSISFEHTHAHKLTHTSSRTQAQCPAQGHSIQPARLPPYHVHHVHGLEVSKEHVFGVLLPSGAPPRS